MNTHKLKYTAILLSVLFIGAVLFGFAAINSTTSWTQVWSVFGILIVGAILFNLWLFRLIEQREDEVHRRSEQMAALHTAALTLTKEIDLATVLQSVVDEARTLVKAQYGALGVLEKESNYIDQFIVSGITPQQRAVLGTPPRGHGLLGALIKTGEPIRVPKISEDPRSVGFPPNHPPMRSLLGVPIAFQGEILGDLYLTDKLNPAGKVTAFSEQDQQLLEMFATQAAIAIKNAQFHRQSQQLTLLQERDRFGMDLHDGIIQSIYGVGLSLESALHSFEEDPEDAKRRVHHSIESLNQAIRDLRAYILDLRPRQMGSEGLMSGLNRLITEFRANTLATVQLTGTDHELQELPQPRSMALFHIGQEALANIAKHARATQVDISLWCTDERVLMEIRDNGKGFEMEKMNATIGHGLANMQTRARSVGGDVDISSVVGEGTTVLAWVPRGSRG